MFATHSPVQGNGLVTGIALQGPAFNHLVHRCVGLAAMMAQGAHQALSQYRAHCRSQQVILHIHVQQAGNTAGGIVGVQCRQYQVSGQCGLHCNGCGFLVAHFADHDNIGVLAYDGAQRSGEGQSNLWLDLHLVDPLDVVFYRVLHGEDLALGGVEMLECRIQCSGLTAAGRTGNQQDTVGLGEDIDHLVLEFQAEPQCIEIQRNIIPV